MKMADAPAVVRRNRPGTNIEKWCRWPDESFDEMESTLAVQQFIQQAIRKDVTNIEAILTPPEGQDEGVWKYEHLRQFCMELNGLAVKLQHECNPDSCTQMTATEQWIFLCAAHKTPKESGLFNGWHSKKCPAIDYTRHTLDGAACLLNSTKYFPSRVSIKESSVAKLGSVCRRVYRIFSHAYFHHRMLFDEFEEFRFIRHTKGEAPIDVVRLATSKVGDPSDFTKTQRMSHDYLFMRKNETNLCRRFTTFVTKYNLMPKDNLIVPILEDQAALNGESEA